MLASSLAPVLAEVAVSRATRRHRVDCVILPLLGALMLLMLLLVPVVGCEAGHP